METLRLTLMVAWKAHTDAFGDGIPTNVYNRTRQLGHFEVGLAEFGIVNVQSGEGRRSPPFGETHGRGRIGCCCRVRVGGFDIWGGDGCRIVVVRNIGARDTSTFGKEIGGEVAVLRRI